VENVGVTKIFDNTAISAFINEIPSIEMLKVCSQYYVLTTSIEVYQETLAGCDEKTVNLYYTTIIVVDKNREKTYSSLMRILSDRYPYLHKGDISSFLLAYIDYASSGKPYYYVTDDKNLRKKIPEILSSATLKSLIKKDIQKFNMTGIIGLMRHIADNGNLSKSDIELIISDLKRSTFYVTEDLLSYLRSGKK
jgi:predicted nucleic acid-binding protein